MPRYLLRFAALALAAPLLLTACRDNADPVKPKVTQPVSATPAM
jgi:hypothetical protein